MSEILSGSGDAALSFWVHESALCRFVVPEPGASRGRQKQNRRPAQVVAGDLAELHARSKLTATAAELLAYHPVVTEWRCPNPHPRLIYTPTISTQLSYLNFCVVGVGVLGSWWWTRTSSSSARSHDLNENSFPVSLFGVGDKLMNIMNPREGV